jgi:recombination protein RecT
MNIDGKGAAAKVAQVKTETMADYLQRKALSFQQLLPRGMDPARFVRMALKAMIANPRLQHCDKASMIIALGTAAELGLEPNGALGYGAIVPFNNRQRGILEAKFMLGYKGLLELMYRTEIFQTITAHEVCENDQFEYEYGLNAQLKHVPAMRERGPVVAFYAYYKTKDGGFDFQVASKEELLAWGQKYSRSFGDADSPWRTAEDEMCKKTLLRKLGKYCPVQVEIPGEEADYAQSEDLGKYQAILEEPQAPAALPAPVKSAEPKAEEQPGKPTETPNTTQSPETKTISPGSTSSPQPVNTSAAPAKPAAQPEIF